MPIPDFQTIMLPLLKLMGDGKEHTSKEIREVIAKSFHLSNEELNEKLPNNKKPVYLNRVAWALAHIKGAGLIENINRGGYRITNRGKDVLNSKINKIDMKYLHQFPDYYEFKYGKKKVLDDKANHIEQENNYPIEDIETRTPEEVIEESYNIIRNKLAHELLDQIRTCTPGFFEKLVVELLVKMGYGGSMEEASAEVVGKSGDEGIDGIIKEDKLGLDAIYIQAKRWENAVSRPEIQKFAGALMGKRAKKGVFITNSYFTKGAVDYTNSIESKIVLIDRRQETCPVHD